MTDETESSSRFRRAPLNTGTSGRDHMNRPVLSCAKQFNARRDDAGIAELFQEGATKQCAVWRAPEGLDAKRLASALLLLAVEPPHRRKTALNPNTLRQAELLDSCDRVHSGRDHMNRWVLSCATQFNARRNAAGIAELFQEGATKQCAVWRAPEGLDAKRPASALLLLAVEPPQRRKTALNPNTLRQAELLDSCDLVH